MKKISKTVLCTNEEDTEGSSVSESIFVSSTENDLWQTQTQSCTEDLLEDKFENVFYNTFRNACVNKLNFVSVRFFTVFYNKMMADFSQSVTTDSNSIDVCTTHVKGLKCEIRIDIHSQTTIITGVGNNLWRKEYFPKIAASLLKRYVEETDSQLHTESNLVYHKEARQGMDMFHTVMQTDTADRRPSFLNVDVPTFTSTPFIQRHEEQRGIERTSVLFYVLPCVILFLWFFSPFSIAITSLGEERANLSAFRTVTE